MRNLKKFLALVLAMLMVVSAGAAVSAFDDVAEDNQYAAAIEKLAGYGIVNGTGDGLFSPEDGVTRTQMAIMMARALNPAETNWEDGMAIFSDVTEWYGAIAYAYMNGIVNGVSTTEMLFNPDGGILYQDALIMAVRALGYSVSTSGNPYWLAAYSKATELGLTANMGVKDGAKALNRAECAQLIANMIAAKPADNGATIEAKNFGVATVDNTTTFVVTATPKQQFDSSAKPSVDGTVGIQKLVNGIPTGDINYVPAADLGITDVEASFARTVNFINYDEATGKSDRIELGDAPIALAASSVSVKDEGTGKITIDGVTYYVVSEITGSNIKNELVIFKGTSTATKQVELPVDSDGNVVNAKGEVIARTVKVGSTVMYSYNDKLYTADELKKVEGVGVEVSNNVTYGTYTAKEVKALNNNYRINLYDDNNDGIYDRASVETVYIAVYNTKDGKKLNFDTATAGLGKGTEDVTINSDVELAKGDVIVYTYNSATKTMNVLEVLPVQTAKFDKVNTTNRNNGDKNSSNYMNVTVTVDGNNYVLANDARVANGNVGAVINTVSGANLNDITDKVALDFVKWENLVAGATYNFVTYGNSIIAAAMFNNPDNYDVVVMKGINSFANGNNVYMDVYANGAVKEVVVSSVVKADGKTVDFAKLNVFTFTSTIADLNNNDLQAGTLCRMRKADDGTVKLEVIKNTVDEYKQQVTAEVGTLKFDGGIADKIDGVLDNTNAIRTNANTVFYFINGTSVTKFVGTPANGTWINLNVAKVYSNKIGYTGRGDNNGVSGTVIVEYTGELSKATNIINPETTKNVVYILDKVEPTYTMAVASEFGFSGNDIYREYTVNAINLNTGAKVEKIYVKNETGAIAPAKGDFLSAEVGTNIVKAKADEGSYKTIDVKASDFEPARTWTIKGLDVTTITEVKLTKKGEYDLKTNEPAKVLDDANVTYTVAYVLSNGNKTFIGAVVKTTADKPATRSFTVKVVGATEIAPVKVIVTSNGADTSYNKLFTADGEYVFEVANTDASYQIRVEAAVEVEVSNWDATTRSYTVTVKG
ncbi:MAG: S-layer homology domain-containing protein [Clostridiales bacterium]|nr:S-layer homology domain-containing protein [Clostridiales bacterium]